MMELFRTLIGLLYIARAIQAEPDVDPAETSNFEKFQHESLDHKLPSIPLQMNVFGSIFQTAYYFVDVNIGAPKPQSTSMIIDTGSSTQGIPCQDCESCGHSHWDAYYNRTMSDYNHKMPCGECSTCRLIADEASLRDLVPVLRKFADDPEAFQEAASKLLLNDPERMQCLYNVCPAILQEDRYFASSQVHYAEGSSLSGLFFTDVIWLVRACLDFKLSDTFLSL